jgi:hypothetical protein
MKLSETIGTMTTSTKKRVRRARKLMCGGALRRDPAYSRWRLE